MKSKILVIVIFALLAFGAASQPMQASARTVATGAAVSSVKAQDKEKAQTTEKSKTAESSQSEEKAAYSSSDLRLMASIINCEAGAESYQGKLAVGIVIMNRIASKSFPDTLHKVIYQKGQFSPVRNGALKKRLAQYDAGRTGSQQWKDCIRAAKSVMEGQDYITYRGSKKSMKGYHFFSVYLSGARFRLGGHRFK